MFKLVEIRDVVRVDPRFLGKDVKEAIKQSLAESLEGEVDQNVGAILAITDVKEFGEGEIRHGDAGVYFPVVYEALVYKPENNEVTLGEVIEIAEFGAFIRIGAFDALCHISQLMQDRVAYDRKNAIIVGRKTKRKLQEGDVVRCRITGVSMGKTRQRISLTMRQPFLGSLKWIEEEKRKLKEKEKKKK